MSQLTVRLLSGSRPKPRSSPWPERFGAIADRLVAAYGTPSLGNFRDPVQEIFYIALSAKTTDAQYRKTHRALRKGFPTLHELAEASVTTILRCIVGGGLANKRAGQMKGIATRLLADLGPNPSSRLKKMSAEEAYAYLTGLPGMGPKSALCVMMCSLGFDVFPVDANVARVASRIGAISARLKHYQAQRRLPALIPEGRGKELHVGLVVHGRTTCLPRKPRCESCVIRDLCNFGKKKIGIREEINAHTG
jgi:endonuclease III